EHLNHIREGWDSFFYFFSLQAADSSNEKSVMKKSLAGLWAVFISHITKTFICGLLTQTKVLPKH
ncbi:MAG: hypothetical protein C4329_13580, partial [Chitinophagaceae bacterium]